MGKLCPAVTGPVDRVGQGTREGRGEKDNSWPLQNRRASSGDDEVEGARQRGQEGCRHVVF